MPDTNEEIPMPVRVGDANQSVPAVEPGHLPIAAPAPHVSYRNQTITVESRPAESTPKDIRDLSGFDLVPIREWALANFMSIYPGFAELEAKF